MVIAEIAATGVLFAAVTGGSVRNLAREQVRLGTLLLVLLPLQASWPAMAIALDISPALSLIVWLAMMSLLSAVLLANATRRPALVIAALGIALNVCVVGLNLGMPVRVASAEALGASSAQIAAALHASPLHVPEDGGTVLPLLGDRIPVPGPSWQAGLVSLGDLLLGCGLAGWLYSATKWVRPNQTAH